jgi:hypothetical protein
MMDMGRRDGDGDGDGDGDAHRGIAENPQSILRFTGMHELYTLALPYIASCDSIHDAARCC